MRIKQAKQAMPLKQVMPVKHMLCVENFLKRNSIVVIYMTICLLTIGFNAFATEDMWTAATRIIKDVYKQIAAISTVLAGVMTAVAVIGAKMSNNQHKVDQSWDWMKRIWMAWIIINSMAAFLAYIVPLFKDMGGLDFTVPTPTP